MNNIMDSLLGLYDMMEKDFGEERKKKRNFRHIRTYFDMEEQDGYTIDEIKSNLDSKENKNKIFESSVNKKRWWILFWPLSKCLCCGGDDAFYSKGLSIKTM